MCARLKTCLYGTRDAASQWEALYVRELTRLGFRKGLASAFCFSHAERDIQCGVHGDDFVFLGTDRQLNLDSPGDAEGLHVQCRGAVGKWP